MFSFSNLLQQQPTTAQKRRMCIISICTRIYFNCRGILLLRSYMRSQKPELYPYTGWATKAVLLEGPSAGCAMRWNLSPLFSIVGVVMADSSRALTPTSHSLSLTCELSVG